jgi:hypothetical protein
LPFSDFVSASFAAAGSRTAKQLGYPPAGLVHFLGFQRFPRSCLGVFNFRDDLCQAMLVRHNSFWVQAPKMAL